MLGIDATCSENENRVGEGKGGMDGCVYVLVSHLNLCVCVCVCVCVRARLMCHSFRALGILVLRMLFFLCYLIDF